MIVLDLSILNQKGTPMFNSDLTANRPAAGIVGRIFIATDSPYGIFRDTGTAWDQIAGSGGGGNTIYTANDTLTSNRTVASGGFSLTINPSTTFATTLTAAIASGAVSAFGVNTLSYAAAFSSSNLGNVYGAIGGFNLQTFAGSATFANANLAAANTSINSVDFSSGGSTITMTQATGLRVMAGHINMFQYQGTNSGTISHAAVSQNLGFYRPTSATGILTITNAYGHLINDLNDYGSGFTFTNRWGIYQAGASDRNHFNGRVIIGSTTDFGYNLAVFGTSYISGNSLFGGTLVVNNSSNPTATIQSNGGTTTSTKLALYGPSFSPVGQILCAIGSGDTSFSASLRNSSANIAVSGYWISTNGTGSPSASDVCFYAFSSKSISINSVTEYASAQLAIDSTTKGLLFPRMTTVQKNAIGTPAAGLVVYDTTLNKLCVYTTAWQTITSI